MSSLKDKVEAMFWNSLESDEPDICPDLSFDKLFRLMGLDDNQLDEELSISAKEHIYANRVSFADESQNSEPEDDWPSDSEDNEVFENFRVNKEETQEQGEIPNPNFVFGESSQAPKKRKGKETKLPGMNRENHGRTESPYSATVLNLDCLNLKEQKEKIDMWNKEIMHIVSTNPDRYTSFDVVLLLVDQKTIGKANDLFKKVNWTSTDPVEIVKEITTVFYLYFLGLDYTTGGEGEIKKEQEEAKHNLDSMQLCDLCELDQFSCTFEKYMYKLKTSEHPRYVEMFINKLPIIGDKVKTDFLKQRNDVTKFSLGLAIKLAKEQIGFICQEAKIAKKIRKLNSKCCYLSEKPQLVFGCNPPKRVKTKRSFKKRFKKKYHFRKKRRKFVPQRYFKPKTDGKKKFCPKGKKNCRCWVCNEECHYANECPNRSEHKQQAKLLEEILIQNPNIDPLEDTYSDEEPVLILEEILEEEQSESSDSSNGSSSSDSEDLE